MHGKSSIDNPIRRHVTCILVQRLYVWLLGMIVGCIQIGDIQSVVPDCFF